MKSFILPLAFSLFLSVSQNNVYAKDNSVRFRRTKNVERDVLSMEEKVRELVNIGSGDYWDAMSMPPTKAPVAPQTPPPYTPPPYTPPPYPSPTASPYVPATPAPVLAPVATFPPITPSPTITADTVPPVPPVAPTVAPINYTPPPVPAPVYPTPAPVYYAPTPAPVYFAPTPAPIYTTKAPVPSPTAVPTTQATTPPVSTPPPTVRPTAAPVAVPTAAPVSTAPPTGRPVTTPTSAPVAPTAAPVATAPPSAPPTTRPNAPPTPPPTVRPTTPPTAPPTQLPTVRPTAPPTAPPTQPPTPASGVATRLQPFLIQGGNEFTDPNSYQSCALARVEQQVGVDSFSDAKLTQYYALYCIFCSTNAKPNIITNADPQFANVATFPGWTRSDGWTSNNTDPCTPWYGIVCVNNQVTEVNLFENFLTGIWPLEITMLASDGPRSTGAGALTKIDLFSNQYLFNNFDNSWMSQLGSNMSRLYFQDTAFAGPLAPLPVNIFEFDCSFTLIDGGLTNANFAGLNKLNWALMDGNAYNSSVPTALASLPELEYLYLSDSFIVGDLSYMQGMTKIVQHWIDVNPGLGGTIPTFIGTLGTLESWSVTQTGLNGPIPSELGNLNNLAQLWLYGNNLSGTIPSQLAQPPSLALLQLEGNSLVGAMPTEICQKRAFPGILETLGVDCSEVSCAPGTCCTCCSLAECNPDLF